MKKLLFILCSTIISMQAMENKLPAPLEKMKQESPSLYELWRQEVWPDEKIKQYNEVMQQVDVMLAEMLNKEDSHQQNNTLTKATQTE